MKKPPRKLSAYYSEQAARQVGYRSYELWDGSGRVNVTVVQEYPILENGYKWTDTKYVGLVKDGTCGVCHPPTECYVGATYPLLFTGMNFFPSGKHES